MTRKSPSQIEVFQRKIEIAQEAVGKITDDSLKTVAFQTILQKLLMSSDATDIDNEQIPEETKPSKKEETPKTKQPKGPKGRIEELILDGFFSQKRTIGDVKAGMEAHGWFHRVEDINPTLLRLIHAAGQEDC